MRKSVLAVMAAGSVFAITAAGATGLTVTNSTDAVKVANTGSGAAFAASACNDAYDVTWTTTNEAKIDSVTLTDKTAANAGAIPAVCKGATFKVSLGATDFTGTISSDSLVSTTSVGGPYNVPASASITPAVTITPAA